MNPGLYSTGNEVWGTPQAVFLRLEREFSFDLDPCPGEASKVLGWGMLPGMRGLADGLRDPWLPFRAAFVNPPYGRAIRSWIQRAVDEADDRHRVVLLIPARTDTGWWHDLILPAAQEIRFLRGRLGFTGVTPKLEKGHRKPRSRAPFPSVVVVL